VTAPTYSDARDRRLVTVTRPDRPACTARLVSLPNYNRRGRGRRANGGRAVVQLASGAHLSVPVRSIELVEP